MSPQHARVRGTFRQALKSLSLKCHYCCELATTNDHAIPISRGGQNIPENWRASCLSCNETKGSLTEREFLGLERPILCNCYRAFNTIEARDNHLLALRCKPALRCSCHRLFHSETALLDHLRSKEGKCQSSMTTTSSRITPVVSGSILS
jgi:hypothetical protein